jgi:hypothetical protein
MKKIFIMSFITLTLIGCTHDDLLIETQGVKQELQIVNKVGIKLESVFVSDDVLMNVKLENQGPVTIKIMNISNKVVSKEQVNVKLGDNILKVHTKILPPSSYRIGLYDSNNNMLGITDFNKIN